MEAVGAYGGGKAGGTFDPLAFVQRPPVILRAVCWLFSVIVFGCIGARGWKEGENSRTVCVYNDDTNACNYGVGISVIAFLAAIGFVAGEYLFEQMSSVKTRKHYVLGDLGFSAFWSFLYFVGFCYLTNAWNKTGEYPPGSGNNMRAAIAFSFFAIFSWAGCAYLAFMRFRQGADAAFAPTYEVEGGVGAPGGFPSYPGATDPDPDFNEPPFSHSAAPGSVEYQAPTY